MGIIDPADSSTGPKAFKHCLEAIQCLGDLFVDERDNLLLASFQDLVLAIIKISV